jgi:hypothetical protein
MVIHMSYIDIHLCLNSANKNKKNNKQLSHIGADLAATAAPQPGTA